MEPFASQLSQLIFYDLGFAQLSSAVSVVAWLKIPQSAKMGPFAEDLKNLKGVKCAQATSSLE
jgi:hypothetical protein